MCSLGKNQPHIPAGAPTTASVYQPAKSGGDDFLLARFDPAGVMGFCTYLGGNAAESLDTPSLVIGTDGNAVIASRRAARARTPEIAGRVQILTPMGESPFRSFVMDGGEMVDYVHTYFPITRLEMVVNNPHPLFDPNYYEVQYRVFQKDLGWSAWGCKGSTAGGGPVPISAVEIKLLVGT